MKITDNFGESLSSEEELREGRIVPQQELTIISIAHIMSYMDIKELTEQMHQFVTSKGWYDAASSRPQTLKNLAISLVLEACEVLEHFQWQEHLQDTAELEEELADVFLYLLQISSLAEIDLEKATLEKLAKNYHRKWKV